MAYLRDCTHFRIAAIYCSSVNRISKLSPVYRPTLRQLGVEPCLACLFLPNGDGAGGLGTDIAYGRAYDPGLCPSLDIASSDSLPLSPFATRSSRQRLSRQGCCRLESTAVSDDERLYWDDRFPSRAIIYGDTLIIHARTAS